MFFENSEKCSGDIAKYSCIVYIQHMANIVSILIGIVTLILTAIAFIPLLGWANWLIIPFSVIGLIFGLISSSNTGRNICLIALVLGIVRLSLGGGII